MGLVDKLGRGFRNVLVGSALAFGSIGGSVYARDSEFIRGDANRDEVVNIVDPIYTLNYLFKSGEEPKCMDAADVNDDGRVNLGDAVYGLGYLFEGKPLELPMPFPDRGFDLTRDGLSCSIERVITSDMIPLTLVERDGGFDNLPQVYVLAQNIVSNAIAISLLGSDNIELDGNGKTISFEGSESIVGIYGSGLDNVVIKGFDIDSGQVLGGLEGRPFRGIHLVDSRRVVVENNNIVNKGQGHAIFFEDVEKSRVVGNELYGAGSGTHVANFSRSSDNLIEGNNMSSDGVNLSVDYFSFSNNNIFRDNLILSNGLAVAGIWFQNGENNTIEGNSIETRQDLSMGIVSWGTLHTNIEHNNIVTFRPDSEGIVLSDSDYNFIFGNNILTHGAQSRGIMYNSSNFNEAVANSFETFGINAPIFYYLGRSWGNVTSDSFGVTHGDNSDGVWVDILDGGGNYFSDLNLETNGVDSNIMNIVGRSSFSDEKIRVDFERVRGVNNNLDSQYLNVRGSFPADFYASFTDVDVTGKRVSVNRENDKSFFMDFKWYLDVSVADTSSNPLPDMSVQVYDRENIPLYENPLVTNDSGEIDRQTLLSKVYTSEGVEDRSHYRIEVSGEGYRSVENEFDLLDNVDLEFKLEKEE